MIRFSTPRRFLGLLFSLGVISAVSALAPFSLAHAADMDAKAKVLVTIDDDWSKAAATKDAAKVSAFYAEDAIAYPPNEPAAIGRPAAQKVWANYFVDKTFTISWKTLHAEIAKSGDIGYTAGTYEDSYKGPDGKLVHEKGKYTCIWKKQKNGVWKAVHDSWNSDAK